VAAISGTVIVDEFLCRRHRISGCWPGSGANVFGGIEVLLRREGAVLLRMRQRGQGLQWPYAAFRGKHIDIGFLTLLPAAHDAAGTGVGIE